MSRKLELGIILTSIIFVLLAHKSLALGAAAIADHIGEATGANVVDFIDICNNIYYW